MTRRGFVVYYFQLLVLAPVLWKRVSSCGCVFPIAGEAPVHQSAASIAVGVDGQEVKMIIEINYKGSAAEFSWLYPVPYAPVLEVGSEQFLDVLFEATLPTFVLDIQEDQDTATCTNIEPLECDDPDESLTYRGPGITVNSGVDSQGVIGPYEYEVIPTVGGSPNEVLNWLRDNDYHLPPGSDTLVNFYALQRMNFVALKLRSGVEVGEIQPLQLTYTVPENEAFDLNPSSSTFAFPMQISSLTAAEEMGVQIYFFSPSRVVPLNYLEVELDDQLVDWVGCVGDQACFYEDYQRRFQEAVANIDNRTFITEYAAPTEILMRTFGTLEITVTVDELLEVVDDAQRFLINMALGGVPADPLVHAVVEKYIPNSFDVAFPFQCARLRNVYSTNAETFVDCFDLFDPPDGWSFNGTALANELDTRVLQPFSKAKEWLSTYNYVTRMYARLGPEQMNKDAFFAVNQNLPNVSNIHKAVGHPYCELNTPTALDVTLESSGDVTQVPAIQGCPTWDKTQSSVSSSTTHHPASQIASWGFKDSTPVVLLPDQNGLFATEAVLEAVLFGESLVTIDQAIPSIGGLEVVIDEEDNLTILDSDSSNSDSSDTSDSLDTSSSSSVALLEQFQLCVMIALAILWL